MALCPLGYFWPFIVLEVCLRGNSLNVYWKILTTGWQKQELCSYFWSISVSLGVFAQTQCVDKAAVVFQGHYWNYVAENVLLLIVLLMDKILFIIGSPFVQWKDDCFFRRGEEMSFCKLGSHALMTRMLNSLKEVLLVNILLLQELLYIVEVVCFRWWNLFYIKTESCFQALTIV